MDARLQKFVDDLTYYLDESEIVVIVGKVDSDGKKVNLKLEADGEVIRVGPFADPGLTVVWLGEVNLGKSDPEPIVRINGLVFSAIANVVAAWVVGAS